DHAASLIVGDVLNAMRIWGIVDGYLYWTSTTNGNIWRCHAGLGCNDPVAIATFDGAVSQFVTDGQFVYWSDNSGIERSPVTGGTITNISDEAANALALDTSNVYWTTEGALVTYAIHYCPKTGCVATPTDYIGGQGASFWMSSDDTFVYW